MHNKIDPALERPRVPPFVPVAFILPFILEACLGVFLLAANKAVDRPLPAFLATPFGTLTIATAAIFGVTLFAYVYMWRQNAQQRAWLFALSLNLISMFLVFAIAEVGLRIITYTVPAVESLFSRGYLPKSWDGIAAKKLALWTQISSKARGDTLLVRDDLLGWTIGPGRISRDGLYASSSEGIRSAKPGVSFRKVRAKHRVALIGDSYTFASGVRMSDSWGAHLQRTLGDEYQVLNFGVEGYGLDQIYLRYVKDVAPWNPDIVVLGFIRHDLHRTLMVYPTISWPSLEMPFDKPRYVLENGNLRLVNVPLASPEVLFSVKRISDLPHLHLEPGYYAADWEWHWYHRSYAVRFALSALPNWPLTRQSYREELLSINSAILRDFVVRAAENGSHPVVVFFPSQHAGDFDTPVGTGEGLRLAEETASRALTSVHDMTPCMSSVARDSLLADDGVHYSAAANLTVAQCIHEHLRELGLLPASH